MLSSVWYSRCGEEWNAFWMTWGTDGEIALGTGNDSSVGHLLNWYNLDPYVIQAFSFTNGYSKETADWRIKLTAGKLSCVSNHRQLGCLSNKLLIALSSSPSSSSSSSSSSITTTLHITDPLSGESNGEVGIPPVTGGFPSERTSNAEKVSSRDVIGPKWWMYFWSCWYCWQHYTLCHRR